MSHLTQLYVVKQQSFVSTRFCSHLIKNSFDFALELQLNTEASSSIQTTHEENNWFDNKMYLEKNITDDINYEESINFDGKLCRLTTHKFY